jgi:membrane-bound serine protease (ClpP class)
MPRYSDNRSGRVARRLLLALVATLLVVPRLAPTDAQDEPQAPPAQQPAARFLTLSSPIGDETIAWVRSAGLELQELAVKEGRKAYLVLEITPGTSTFHQVYGLADFLSSASLPNVTTIAWVPKTVVGNNVVVALACGEIVMHPDAQLGDIGLGRALEPEQQNVVRSMVSKRRNKKVNESLATALMDPQATLVQLTLEPETGATEKRLVTEDEAERIRRSGVVIRDRQTLKDAGAPGLFSGATARGNDILIVRTAQDRRELADAYTLPGESLREQRAPGAGSAVSLIEVKGMIDPLLESFLLRQIDRAVAGGSKTIIFEIESPGGMMYESRDLAFAIADLEHRDIRTVAYVPKEAYSGAAFIALGCDEIYLQERGSQTAQIGDILPLEMREGGVMERAPEKILAPLREWLHDIAVAKGRPAGLCMAMADPKIDIYRATNKRTGQVAFMSEDELHQAGEDWLKGEPIEESRGDVPLTLRAGRAHELGIAEAPVAGFDEVKQRVGVPLDLNPVKIGRTWIDDLVWVLNNSFVTGLLFFIGIICIYLELHFMTGLLGIVSALCFALFFWSKVLGGTAGWLEVVLFLFGLGCLALEIFVLPGFGVFGVSGILLIFAGLVMASQTFGNLETGRDMSAATTTLGTLSASVLAVIVIAMALSRFLPRIPILNQMILTPPGMHDMAGPDEPRLRPDLTGSAAGALVGKQGAALTVLRPAGKAQIDGRLLDVVSDGPFIPEGAPIEVLQISGNRIVVRQV